jgi:PadR family transcriptional regulator AphA
VQGVTKTSPATFGLLGLLASRSWTGYELTRQVRRSIRFLWPVSEAHLYREQKHLVALGWAEVVEELSGQRTRKRYIITESGREALQAWLSSDPGEPQLQVEGLLRAFYAGFGTPADLTASARCTAQDARRLVDELAAFAEEYLAAGGPMESLERGIGLAPDQRLEFGGRPMFPERLPSVAAALDVATALLTELETAFGELADEASTWASTSSPTLAGPTRQRLERAAARRRRAESRPESTRG